MAESKETLERVAPRIHLVLCAGADRGWLDRALAEAEAARVAIEVVVVASGTAPKAGTAHWVQVEEGASVAAMRTAGFTAVGESDVIWFEAAPTPVDWGQLIELATAGIVEPTSVDGWAGKLEALRVSNPSQEGRQG